MSKETAPHQTLEYGANRYHRVKELFQAALEKPFAEREAFLVAACGDDLSLRKEVEELIEMSDEAEDFIEEPAFKLEDNRTTKILDPVFEGRRVGNYQIIREIGHGGMGAVYLAVRADDQYKKRVAIKIIRGGSENEFIRRRFLSERQILASLDHPNIARLLDGGTEEGIPYLVMDYIEGLAIDEYCDRNKLSTVERLKLFQAVCSAVHYAHQNLVIHRDLKPSNILVSADGVPHLLDFGIAKILNPALSGLTFDLTAGSMGPMTPEYASPEQVRGEALTTTSDIYSLGVVLYELLTGHRPYQFQSRVPHLIAQVICEQEPEKPSTVINRLQTNPYGAATETILSPEIVSRTREGQPDKLRRKLQGDLDNIILMAMRKESPRRYASVEQFSEDIRRHLEGLPVIARQPTLAYRTAKFVKRNKVGVAAAALVLLAIIAGVLATLWQARLAHIQKAKAEQRFNDVRQLANSFMFEIQDSIEKLPGSTPARQLLVSNALKYLDSLAVESGDNASLQRELATAYDKVGDIQGNPYYANLGDVDGAIQSYKKSLTLREQLFASDPKNLSLGLELSKLYQKSGDMFEMEHENDAAQKIYQQSLELCEKLALQEPGNPEIRWHLSSAYEQLGKILSVSGKSEEGLASMRKGLALNEALLSETPNDAAARRRVAISLYLISSWIFDRGNKTEALESSRKAVQMLDDIARNEPLNARAQRELGGALNSFGDINWFSGNITAAHENYQKATSIREALASADPLNVQFKRDLATSYTNVGYTLVQTGKMEEGLADYRKGVAIFEALLAANPNHANTLRDVAIAYKYFGDVHEFLAEQKAISVSKRIAYYQQASSWYDRSRKLYLDMGARGILKAIDSSDAEKLSGDMLKCNQAIEKLHGQ